MRARIAQATAPRYVVKSLLGSGGMAGVYLAEETRLGRFVAIKVMAPALMADPAFVGRFEQEARVIARLAHPNIVTIFEIDRRAGLYYFVMEHVPGPTLRQVMAERHGEPLPVPIVLHWIAEVASALSYAHGAGVVHRDVKPANIMLDSQGGVRVTDFGIAKVADDAGLTRTGFFVGTPSYMSPEQCGAGAVTGASDQYVLGVVAYELVAGRPPFAGPTMEVLQAHLTQPPPPLGDLRPDCPPVVRSGIERMLSKRPEDRYPSVVAAAAAIGAQPLPDGHPDRERLDELTGLKPTRLETAAKKPPSGQRRSDAVGHVEPSGSTTLPHQDTLASGGAGTARTTGDKSGESDETVPRQRAWLVAASLVVVAGAVAAAVLRNGPEADSPAGPGGEIQIAGALPVDAEITIRDGDSTWRVQAGATQLASGLYMLEATAPEHDTVRTEVRVEAGAVATWSPTLTPLPEPQGTMEATEPEPTPPPEPVEPVQSELTQPEPVQTEATPPQDTRTGEIRITGALPAEVEITIYDGDTARALVGRTIELPPGSYSLEATAPKHDTARAFLTLEADRATEWSPVLTPLDATPVPDPPEMPEPDRDAIEAEIRDLIDSLARALERRDVDAVIREYPAATGWAEEWREFFEAERDVRELQIRLDRVAALDAEGDIVRVSFSLAVEFRDLNGRPQDNLVDFRASFQRVESVWTLSELGQEGS